MQRDASEPGREVHEPLQLRIDGGRGDAGVRDEVEQLLHGQCRHAGALKEGVDVLDVLPQEVQGAGVVQIHRLADVDDVQLTLPCTQRERLSQGYGESLLQSKQLDKHEDQGTVQ